jgi:hypothetical protein
MARRLGRCCPSTCVGREGAARVSGNPRAGIGVPRCRRARCHHRYRRADGRDRDLDAPAAHRSRWLRFCSRRRAVTASARARPLSFAGYSAKRVRAAHRALVVARPDRVLARRRRLGRERKRHACVAADPPPWTGVRPELGRASSASRRRSATRSESVRPPLRPALRRRAWPAVPSAAGTPRPRAPRWRRTPRRSGTPGGSRR